MQKENIFKLCFDDIPNDFCVIRLKKTNTYFHLNDKEIFFLNRLHGCFVSSFDSAHIVLENLMDMKSIIKLDIEQLEIVNFKVAYKEHGLIEKQIMYN